MSCQKGRGTGRARSLTALLLILLKTNNSPWVLGEARKPVRGAGAGDGGAGGGAGVDCAGGCAGGCGGLEADI